MNATITAEITRKAKAAARAFVDKFGEPCDTEHTDWDSVAYEIDSAESEYAWPNDAWDLYRDTLIVETLRLTKVGAPLRTTR